MAYSFSKFVFLGVVAASLASGGCTDSGERAGPDEMGTPDPSVSTPSPSASGGETPVPTNASPPPGYTDGSGINEGYPDLTPAVLSPDAERSEAGARNVLLNFARALEMREYDQAWAILGAQAQNQWSKARFNSLFDGLRDITVAVSDGIMEGAAGSSYYTSDAEITATEASGSPLRIEGPIGLRRVNDLPGSSAEERRWHIEQFDISVTH